MLSLHFHYRTPLALTGGLATCLAACLVVTLAQPVQADAAQRAKPTQTTLTANVQAQIASGRALLHKGEFERAKEQMQRAVKLSQGSPEALFEVARVQFAKDNYRGSRAACRALKKAHPDHVLYDVCMARAFLVWRRASRAEEPLQQARSKAAEHVEVQFALAETARMRSDFARGDAAYRKVLAQDPEYLEAHLGLAASLRLQGLHTKARQVLKDGVQRFPDHPQLRYQLGLLSHSDEAVGHLERALAAKPRWVDAERALAKALLTAGRHKDAERRLLAILRRSPKDALAMGHLAAAQLGLGRAKEAEATAQRALSLRPDHPEAALLLARLYAGSERIEEAFETYQKAAGLRPADVTPLREAAELAHKEGRDVLASAFLDRALRRNPRAPHLYALQGDVLVARGQKQAAAESYRRALEMPTQPPVAGQPPAPIVHGPDIERKLRGLQ